MDQTQRPGPRVAVAAYVVHIYTASGVVLALLAAAELCLPEPHLKRLFTWLALAVVIDATDGSLARAVNVKQVLPHISGRTIDDIVDYLTYSFVPLLLVWRMGWMPGPGGLWVALALIASLFGFSNVSAKQEDDGFFLGFPSYWNIFAYYAGPWFHHHGPWLVGGVLIALTVLTVLPVRFIYPNLAPRPWRGALLVGAAIWMAALLAMLPWYPAIPAWAVWASWVYPAFYIVLSVLLDVRGRRTARAAASGLADPAGDIGG